MHFKALNISHLIIAGQTPSTHGGVRPGSGSFQWIYTLFLPQWPDYMIGYWLIKELYKRLKAVFIVMILTFDIFDCIPASDHIIGINHFFLYLSHRLSTSWSLFWLIETSDCALIPTAGCAPCFLARNSSSPIYKHIALGRGWNRLPPH